jgi:hypothetical protein
LSRRRRARPANYSGSRTPAQVSTWADEIRTQRRDGISSTSRFIRRRARRAAYDAARDCQPGDFVVAAIERFTAVLHDSSAPPRQRLEALG